HAMEAEFGRAQWQLGTSTWAFADASRMVVAYAQRGRWHLAAIDLPTGTFRPIAFDVEPADSIAATATDAVLVGGSPNAPDAVLRIDLTTGAVEHVRASSAVELPERFVSAPRAIEF